MSSSLVNRIEDAWEILERVRLEVAPMVVSPAPSGKTAAVKLLDDIEQTVKVIREKISPCQT